MNKSEKRFAASFITFWVTALILCLGFWAGLIYIALHFIMKVW